MPSRFRRLETGLWSIGSSTRVKCGDRGVSLDPGSPGQRLIFGEEVLPPDSGSIRLRREVERWFLKFRDPVFRYLLTLGCPGWLAEEIAQEAFLRLHSALKDGLKVKDVRAWVFRVARNLWIDHERERRRYRTEGPDDHRQADHAQTDSQPNPEQLMLKREWIRLIEQELLRLPRLQRECMRLKAQGLRYHEIAVALDISMTAAVDGVRRAVKRIRTRLSD